MYVEFVSFRCALNPKKKKSFRDLERKRKGTLEQPPPPLLAHVYGPWDLFSHYQKITSEGEISISNIGIVTHICKHLDNIRPLGGAVFHFNKRSCCIWQEAPPV